MSESDDRECDRSSFGTRVLVPLVGFLALVWFLIRVIPQPSRAAYPCQRAAFPLASAFVLWIVGIFTSGYLLRRGTTLFSDKRWFAAVACMVLALCAGAFALLIQPSSPSLAVPDPVNAPIGEAVGIHPGRVVWYHDRDATDWEGPGSGHWWEAEHTDQSVVEVMLSSTIQMLTGETDETLAWDALIRHYNIEHGRGDVGYTPGEKIMIKINMVGCYFRSSNVDPESYDLVSRLDYMNTSPQVMLALLRQLVYEVGAEQSDITIGDSLSRFPNQYHAMLAGEFPDVNYLDHYGGTQEHPRVAVQNSTVPMHWSSHPSGYQQDYILESYAQATYFINLANFKSHSRSGVTLCAKNHYGSLIRWPAQEDFYDMHLTRAYELPDSASFRCIVDLMGHAHLGGKTVLYLIDGLYSGCHPEDDAPQRWAHDPFGNDWTSSLFASQDPVAIESVCFDLMQLEGDPRLYPQMEGVDDYLHEAALAYDPPSGTFYDPDHDGDVSRLPSLGVHEHWNDPVNMQYSRNLGTGDGIELKRLTPLTDVPQSRAHLALFCYPNPFNPMTTIHFELPVAGRVVLTVYDAAGVRIASLVDKDLGPGSHEVAWQGRDDLGRELPTGVYFYRIQQGNILESGKMTLVK